jgi:rhodanese-related sulfurtransferase
MKSFFKNLTLNKRLGLLLFVLGFFALLAGSPYHGSGVTLDAKELAAIIQTEADHVSAEELAGWIIEGTSDFRLIDLRSEAEYASYHIPGAENVQLTALPDYGLLRNEKIVLYSEGGIHSAQAWFLLKAKDYKGVYMLLGGLEDWKDLILFPKLPANASPDQLAAFEKTKKVSTFFGGTPQTGTAEAAPSVAVTMPKLEAPAPAAGSAVAPVKKKKEGC